MAKKYIKRTNDLRQTIIRMPAAMYDQISEESQRAGMSLNAYTVRLIARGRMLESGSGHASLRTAEQTVSGCTQLPH